MQRPFRFHIEARAAVKQLRAYKELDVTGQSLAFDGHVLSVAQVGGDALQVGRAAEVVDGVVHHALKGAAVAYLSARTHVFLNDLPHDALNVGSLGFRVVVLERFRKTAVA